MTKKHSAAPSKSGRRGIFVGTGSLKSTLSNRISTKYPNQLYVMSQANANKANCAAIRCNFRGMETKHYFEQRKKSSRFSTRFRCERRGRKCQTALPFAAASGRRHCRSRQQMANRTAARGCKRRRWHTVSKLRRYPVQFAGRWEESIASNKERNRVASRLDFDVKGAAASGYRA